MATPSFSSAVIARAAAALYGIQLGNGTMNAVLNEAANSSGGIDALINAAYARDFGSATNASVAATVVANLGITGSSATNAVAYVTNVLNAAAPGAKGAAIANTTALFAGLTGDATYGAAATAFNGRIDSALAYAQRGGTVDRAFLAGATITATTGQDFLTGTPGNDTIIARIFDNSNTLQSGDWVDGGLGIDRLEADLGASQSFAITPETTNVETFAVRAQSRATDSGDNNIGTTSETTRVTVDAERMSGVNRYESNSSRADLIIEDVRIQPTQITKDITIAMVGTDPGNVDFGVYFDQPSLRAQSNSSSTLAIELMDTRSSDAGLSPLKENPFNGFQFKLGTTLVKLQSKAFDDAQTYDELVAAVQAMVADAANRTLYPDLAKVTVSKGAPFTAKDTISGRDQSGFQVLLTANGVTLDKGGFLTPDGSVPASSGLHTEQKPAESSSTDLVTSTVILDNVGRGSNGGDLVIGGLSVGETSTSRGVDRFEITVENASRLQTINSTNNALKEVVIVNGTAKGSLSVLGTDAGAASAGFTSHTEQLPGASGEHNTFGFSDVRLIDASAMTGAVSFDAEVRSSSFAKYIQTRDTQADPKGDNTSVAGKTTQVADFIYSGGAGADSITVQIDGGIAASNSTIQVGREDFTFVVNGGGGNDTINVRMVDPANTATGGTATVNWLSHQKANANVTINAGEGDDTVLTPGAGDVRMDLGAGNDTAYVDNTGNQGLAFGTGAQTPISGKAVWAFNTSDQTTPAAVVAARNLTDLRSDTNETYKLYKATVTVTFKGLTASVQLPANVYNVTDLHINQAIKKAINDDPILTKLISAEDGPAYSLIVKSRIDGVMDNTNLGVAITKANVSLLSPTEINAAMAVYDPAQTTPTATMLDQIFDGTVYVFSTAGAVHAGTTQFNANADYATALANNGAATTVGAASVTPSDNRVTPAAGRDVIVLGTTLGAATADSSNDRVVFSGSFDNDTIVNFAVAGAGIDTLDFQALGGLGSAGVTGAGGAAPAVGGLAATTGTIHIHAEDTATDTATEVAALFADAGGAATATVTHVYVAVDTTTNIGKIYSVSDPVGATANVTATLVGTIDLADTLWGTLTAANFNG